MTRLLSTLFTPHTMGSLTIPTRLAMPPMTRERSSDGIPGTDVAAYYERRARNGVGLIITEGTGINHPAAVGGSNVPRFYGDAPLAGWKQVVESVHSAGGKIVPQLWHQGIERKHYDLPFPQVRSVSPSGVYRDGSVIGEPMNECDIETVISAFAQGAAEAQRIGFDGIELHGAHGYLIDQFFWAKTNRRSDCYGGDLVARTRFAVEIIRACRQAVGADYPIILRFSQWKVEAYDAKLVTTPQELEQFVTPLSEAGVDIFHCSTRRFWEPEFSGSALNLAGWTKKITSKPVITVGSIGNDVEAVKAYLQGAQTGQSTLEILLGMIDRGEVDVAAVGRPTLADPEWAAKVRDQRFAELHPIPPDAMETFY